MKTNLPMDVPVIILLVQTFTFGISVDGPTFTGDSDSGKGTVKITLGPNDVAGGQTIPILTDGPIIATLIWDGSTYPQGYWTFEVPPLPFWSQYGSMTVWPDWSVLWLPSAPWSTVPARMQFTQPLPPGREASTLSQVWSDGFLYSRSLVVKFQWDGYYGSAEATWEYSHCPDSDANGECDETIPDQTPPVITLLGFNPFPLECHTEYVEPGFTATDDVSGDLTPLVLVASDVNPNTPGVYTITYVVSDASGNIGSATRFVAVQDTIPPVIEGCPNNISVQTGPERSTCDQVVTWIPPIAHDNCAESVSLTSDHNPGEVFPLGDTTVTYKATDSAGNSSTCSFTVTVKDTTPPQIESCPPRIVSADDNCLARVPDFTSSVIAKDCNGPLRFRQSPAVGELKAPGEYPVHIEVFDAAGNPSPYQCDTKLTVIDYVPTIVGMTGPTEPLLLGSTAKISTSFIDPGISQTHHVSFNWDDGKTDDISVAPIFISDLPITVAVSHTYAGPGVYSVVVTVTDSCGEKDRRAFLYVVVYDPDGGFVTGSGTIDSPRGAYRADPNLVGKATFGFVAKYQKGANLPTGNTDFQFQAAKFTFRSTTYQWLVVSGAKAQFKGTGTISSAGDNNSFSSSSTYNFLLTATDGQISGGGGIDKFRIKITNTSGGVIYDNALGESDDMDKANPQAVASGNIHIKKAN